MAVETFLLISTFIILLTTVPLYSAFKYYRLLKIFDYLVFSIFLLVGMLVVVMFVNYDDERPLYYWQVLEGSLILFDLSILLIGIRSLDFKSQRVLRYYYYLGILLGVLLLVMVMFWELADSRVDDFIFKGLSKDPFYSGLGGGLVISGKTIYSSHYNHLRQIYGFFAFSTFLIAQFALTPIVKTARVSKAIIIWRSSAISGSIFNFVQWAWIFNISPPPMGPVAAFIAIFSISLIVIKYPEGFLLSHAQYFRIVDLVREGSESDTRIKQTDHSVLDYLDDISKYLKTTDLSQNPQKE